MVVRVQSALGAGSRSNLRRDDDENDLPILKALPSKEKAVEICREWMKKLGIDEKDIARAPRGPGGFDVMIYNEAIGQGNSESKPFAMHLIFAQQIGKFPAFWQAHSGCIKFVLADGGEFAGMEGILRPWEPMGEFELLSKDEITEAIKAGFYWADASPNSSHLRVDRVVIEAYHADSGIAQKTFPLIYHLSVRPIDKPVNDNEADVISIPALKIHRDTYGPLKTKPHSPMSKLPSSSLQPAPASEAPKK